jgi:hypothetical protein
LKTIPFRKRGHSTRSVAIGFCLAMGAAIAAVRPACADEPKPDFAIKTKAVDVSVTLDAKIKADPALAADCLAEGRKWAEKNRVEAEKTKRTEPKFFPPDGYIYQRDYVTRSVVGGRYVSIVRNDYESTGGAHPNTYVDTILWDSAARKRISIRPFFTETADGGPTLTAMVKDIVAALKAEKKARDVANSTEIDWYKGIEPKLLRIGPVTLAPSTEAGKSSGLTFHYQPYAVGSYAEGSYVAFVPWERLKPYLTADGAAIFGGARPREDDNEQ